MCARVYCITLSFGVGEGFNFGLLVEEEGEGRRDGRGKLKDGGRYGET